MTLREIFSYIYFISNQKEVLEEITEKLKPLSKMAESADVEKDNEDMSGILNFLIKKINKYIFAMEKGYKYIKTNHENIIEFMGNIVSTEKVFIKFMKENKWKDETLGNFKEFENLIRNFNSIIKEYNNSNFSEIKIPEVDELRKIANEKGIVKF